VLGHTGGRARGQSGPGGPGLADSRPRRVMEPCRKLDHRGSTRPTQSPSQAPQRGTTSGKPNRQQGVRANRIFVNEGGAPRRLEREARYSCPAATNEPLWVHSLCSGTRASFD